MIHSNLFSESTINLISLTKMMWLIYLYIYIYIYIYILLKLYTRYFHNNVLKHALFDKNIGRKINKPVLKKNS